MLAIAAWLIALVAIMIGPMCGAAGQGLVFWGKASAVHLPVLALRRRERASLPAGLAFASFERFRWRPAVLMLAAILPLPLLALFSLLWRLLLLLSLGSLCRCANGHENKQGHGAGTVHHVWGVEHGLVLS